MSSVRLAKAAIKLPKRIERGPTDILRALAGTVRYLPSQLKPGFQDDTFLMPSRAHLQKTYMLSRLSGIKAAKFFLNRNPEMFYRDDAEPKVEAFMGKEEFDRSMNFTEADIEWCIRNCDPLNGAIAYEAMLEKKVPLNDRLLLDFFEMLCYTNQENPKDFIDSQRNQLMPNSDFHLVNMAWKKDGLAVKIFDDISDKLDPPRVYSVMIAGLSRYNEHVSARQMFHNFKHRFPDQALYTEAYDGLIRSVNRLNSSESTITEAMNEIIGHMQTNLVKPNLAIFNSIMYTYRIIRNDEINQQVFNLYNDMQSLEIKPSASTIASLITVLARTNYNKSYEAIISLLDYASSDDSIFQIRDDRDTEFFSRLMRLFNVKNDIKSAKKLHKIYLKQPHFFTSSYHRRRYFDDYFRLVVTTENLDNIYKFYTAYIPHDFEPTPDSYDALAEALELYQAPEDMIDRIVDDIIATRNVGKMKNDAIYRKKQKYIDAEEDLMSRRT